MQPYETLTLRNAGFVSVDTQERIRTSHLLIAGCGIGSFVAEAALRLGFTRLTLCDGDDVAGHNLNRQNYTENDVDRPKVQGLAQRLKSINPSAEILAHGPINEGNAGRLVSEADLVVDTIDFLDIGAIVALHDQARSQGKPIVTAMSAGFGAAAVYFPPGSPVGFRELFGVGENDDPRSLSYVALFSAIIGKLSTRLDPQVVAVVGRALSVMADGKPCPAPQVAPGAMAVAGLVSTILVRIAAGQVVQPAPHLLLSDFVDSCVRASINLAE